MRLLTNVQKIQELIATKDKFLVIFGKNADFDTEAAALSLYLALTKLGKKVTIASPKEPLVEDASLVGIDKVIKELGEKKLQISIEGALESVEKVTHYLEGSKLNVVVHPLPGAPLIDREKIAISYSEADFEVVFAIGISELTEMDNLYTQDNKIYSEGNFVIIGRILPKIDMGYLSLLDPATSSLSETITLLLAQLNVTLDQDIAANLFMGIRQATGSFAAPPATTETFEVATMLLKHGQPKRPNVLQETPMATAQVSSEEPKIEEPQPDWLTPKIFKSSKNP